MFPGVLPNISLASFPTAKTRWSSVVTATTVGSFRTIPEPAKYTKELAVPRSIPTLLEKLNISGCHFTSLKTWSQDTLNESEAISYQSSNSKF